MVHLDQGHTWGCALAATLLQCLVNNLAHEQVADFPGLPFWHLFVVDWVWRYTKTTESLQHWAHKTGCSGTWSSVYHGLQQAQRDARRSVMQELYGLIRVQDKHTTTRVHE